MASVAASKTRIKLTGPLVDEWPTVAMQALAVAAYFLIFILWGAFRHIFVTQPLFRHYIATLTIVGSESLHNIVQRDRDEHREAEGFAEALDLGAAI